MSKIFETLEYAQEHDVPVITTVEAFHKEPELLYEYLNRAANMDVMVQMVPIETTDRSFL